MIVGHIGAGSSVDYEIQKSLRFRANASAYLSRTPTVAGNQKTWTWSGWVKRGRLGVYQSLFTAYDGSSNNDGIAFTAADKIELFSAGAPATYRLTTAVYRDPSSWYHIVVASDTPNATAQNRARIWVNGSEITAFDTNATITQNADWFYNSTNAHNIGRFTAAGYFDGYLSEINFIDGQALDPSYFGQVSAETGSWIPKKYTGTYGTNGFYLPVNDGSTLGNLTADRSGNGNNWTASNISLTFGSSYDWMDDTPTNNFAVLNPLLQSSTLSNANLVATVGSTYKVVPGSMAIDAQNADGVYWESVCTAGTARQAGIVKATQLVNPASNVNQTTAGWAMWHRDGSVYNEGSVIALGVAWAVGDVLGWGLKGGGLYLFKNGVALNGGSPVVTGKTGDWYPFWGNANSTGTDTHLVNFGQFPFLSGALYYPSALGYFAYTPPAGFKALCTKNLPTPSILNPKKHFEVVLATGANIKSTAEAVFPGNFLEWLKDRGNANNHQLIDTVRGASAVLQSNTTGTETTYSAPSGSSVGWTWKAGGAPVTNNAGSIQSQVSANPQAGFSIVTYTGTGANATVGHGLGVAPGLIIQKPRTNSGDANNWQVYHKNAQASGAYVLYLNATSAATNSSTYWQNTAPTSSVFSVGTHLDTNGAVSHVAYCFAEIPGFSKIGSYTGNGSADGPFVYCGFRPRYVLIKRVNAAGNWCVVDTSRSTYNANGLDLCPNLSSAELFIAFDFLSNGIKPRVFDLDYNASGGSYIFYAIAEQPFQYANAR